MEVRLTTPYARNHKIKFHLKDDSVFDAVKNPDSFEDCEFKNGPTLRLYLKKITSANNNLHLLIIGMLFDGYVEVIGGYKVYPDLCEAFASKRKLELLSILAERFGFDVAIGADISKFHYFKRVDLQNEQIRSRTDPDGHTSFNFISIKGKAGVEVFQQMSVYPFVEEGRQFVDCAIVFCLNVDQYAKWIQNH